MRRETSISMRGQDINLRNAGESSPRTVPPTVSHLPRILDFLISCDRVEKTRERLISYYDYIVIYDYIE